MKREDKRSAFVETIPRWYRGVAHFAIINLLGIATLAACLAAVQEARWWEWLFVPGFFVFANCVEWWVHRGPMHHLDPKMKMLYQRHAQEHHVIFTHDDMEFRDPRELMFVLFPPLFFPFLLLITSPVPLVLALTVSRNLAPLYLFSAVAYYLVYEWFHTVHHWPRDTVLGRSFFAGLIRRHHTRHHDPRRMAQGNFNVSFPLADTLLGTSLPPGDDETD